MKDSTKRFYSLIASFAMAIGALVVYTTMISPAFMEVQELRGERQAKEDTYNDYKETIEATNSVLARSQSLSALTDAFNQSIPSSESIPSLLNQVYGLAKMNNVSVGSIDFQTLPIAIVPSDSIIQPLGKVRTTVKCVGNYSDMKNYVRALETNVRLMDIDSLDVSDGNKPNPALIYTITVDAYYQPDTTAPVGGKLSFETAAHSSPGIVIDSPKQGIYNITPDLSLQDRLVSLKLEVLDLGLAISDVPVTVDGSTNGKMTYGNDAWTFVPDKPISFSAGQHKLTAGFKDKAGNASTFTINFLTR